MSPINVSAASSSIDVTAGESTVEIEVSAGQVDVDVIGGQGPQGPPGPQGEPGEGGGGDFLPLAGGTMTGNIVFDETGGQFIGKGLVDTERGGSYGISLVCSVGYQFNWQAGWILATEQNGSTPRPLYLDSAAGTTLRVWDAAEDEGLEVAHDGITFADDSVQATAWTGTVDGGTAGGHGSLLLHFDGADNSTTFTDSSSNNYSVTRGGSATISTAQSKFGGASLALDGDGDYVSTTAPIELGSGDFTIEAWVFVDSESSGTRPIASAYDLAPTPTPFAKWLFYVDGDGTLSFLAENAEQGQWTLQCTGAEVPTDEWAHVAVTRSGGSLHLFVDGVEDTNSVSNAGLNIPSADITAVGKLVENGEGASYFAGYIDEFRIVQGEAIFTGNFAPPTAPYSDASAGGTTILQRRGIAANLAGVTLGAGQIAYETDTGKIKVGNGSTVYTSLAYVGGSPAWADITGKPATFAPSSHTHGNVSNDGLVNGNTASGQIVVTTTGGSLTTAATIASSAVSGLGGAATLNVGTTAGTVAAGDHTHTQLHDRSHAITSSSDHTATSWRAFYSDGSGVITELALGASGTVLTSGGASAAPTFSALPAGGTKTIIRFTPADNQPPSSNFATLDTRNSILVLEFDAATQESANFVGLIPEGASLTNGLAVRLWWMGDTATTGNVRWGVSFEAVGTDNDSDSFSSVTEATGAANGTSGIETVTSITATAIDSLAAGDRFRLRVARIAADATNDTMTGDAQLVAVEVRVA